MLWATRGMLDDIPFGRIGRLGGNGSLSHVNYIIDYALASSKLTSAGKMAFPTRYQVSRHHSCSYGRSRGRLGDGSVPLIYCETKLVRARGTLHVLPIWSVRIHFSFFGMMMPYISQLSAKIWKGSIEGKFILPVLRISSDLT